MIFTRRTALLRLTILAAIAASALLTADHLNPGRSFCPLEQACDAAANSPLGTIMGIPTALIGMAAFGALFLLTLLPVEWSRPLLRPAGALALLAGVGFVLYQAFELETFCPLCLVADGAGILAGLITLTWPTPPMRLSGRRIPGEPGAMRAAWVFAAMVAVFLPIAWPRPAAPSWIEIKPLSEADLERIAEEEPAEVALAPPAETEAPAPADLPRAEPFVPPRVAWRWEPSRRAPPVAPLAAVASAPVAPSPRSPVASPAPDRAEPAGQPAPVPPPASAVAATVTVDAPADTASEPDEAKAPTPVLVVEYLNAYCAHCRATHQRLDAVLAGIDVPVRRVRVYAWGDRGYPLWARACAFAHEQGKEEALFAELLRTRSQAPREVYAAARRVGIDPRALQQAVSRPPPARLVRDCRIMVAAGLQGLPTLDIGRRRLMGGQTAEELEAAIRSASATP